MVSRQTHALVYPPSFKGTFTLVSFLPLPLLDSADLQQSTAVLLRPCTTSTSSVPALYRLIHHFINHLPGRNTLTSPKHLSTYLILPVPNLKIFNQAVQGHSYHRHAIMAPLALFHILVHKVLLEPKILSSHACRPI